MRSDKQMSKYLSLVLRHKPDTIGLKLNESGWGDVSFILNKINDLSMDRLEKIVQEDNKQRYSFNKDKTKIRANQGHSLKVDLQLTPVRPPAVLYHGTACRNETNILSSGLCKMGRQYVHLSADLETAAVVAKRRKGKCVIFQVQALAMFNQGHKFYCSENGVWLTEHVPIKFITVLGYLEEATKGTREAEVKNRIYHKGSK